LVCDRKLLPQSPRLRDEILVDTGERGGLMLGQPVAMPGSLIGIVDLLVP